MSDGPGRAMGEWRALAIAERLGVFDPVVVSSLAADLGTPASDLDIACDTRPGGFVAAARAAYGDRPGFVTWVTGSRTMVAFTGPSLSVELVGEPRPVAEQQAVRHARVQQRLAALGGGDFTAAVRAERAATGAKTEPAIAAVLGLPGEPYAAVDALADAPDAELRGWLTARPIPPS